MHDICPSVLWGIGLIRPCVFCLCLVMLRESWTTGFEGRMIVGGIGMYGSIIAAPAAEAVVVVGDWDWEAGRGIASVFPA